MEKVGGDRGSRQEGIGAGERGGLWEGRSGRGGRERGEGKGEAGIRIGLPCRQCCVSSP